MYLPIDISRLVNKRHRVKPKISFEDGVRILKNAER
jgi:hypothetical protein